MILSIRINTIFHCLNQTLFGLGFCVDLAINCTSDKTVASSFYVTQLLDRSLWVTLNEIAHSAKHQPSDLSWIICRCYVDSRPGSFLCGGAQVKIKRKLLSYRGFLLCLLTRVLSRTRLDNLRPQLVHTG